MTEWAHMAFPLMALACFGMSVASAIFPWIAVEIIVLALPAVAPSLPALAFLVVVTTAGQMAGKCLVYWSGHRTFHRAGPRLAGAVERWRTAMTQRPRGAFGLVFLSSSVGFPPFFLITAAAGALRVDFVPFVIAGTMGRLLRFSAIVFVPHMLAAWTG
jgi:membrane protein YqaA with SNARE-associated domain